LSSGGLRKMGGDCVIQTLVIAIFLKRYLVKCNDQHFKYVYKVLTL
jgi:uncharacterized membrane protein